MFKFAVILFVTVWGLSLFMGKRRRVIKDTTHLLQLIIWAVLVFLGSNIIQTNKTLKDNSLLHLLTVVVLFAASWGISKLIVRHVSKGK